MKKTSKNNKGFSLVELIVVVLIMAIIAVSLAPQVMKWVDRSRQANDASNYDALFAAAQLSVIAAPAGKTGTTDNIITITMDTSKTDSAMTTGTDTDGKIVKAFEDAMEANLPGWDDIAITSKEKTTSYTIVITNTTVTKGTSHPEEIDAD